MDDREYRVEELAQAAGIGVATVRFYQSRGLLPPPERRGRIGWYSDDHLDRVRRIRSLNQQGLTLEAVRRALDDEGTGIRGSLLDALDEAEGQASFSRSELAARGQVPEFLLTTLEDAGLLHPMPGDPPRYSESDLRAIEAARGLLESGLPQTALLALAAEHATHTENLAERAVELFETFARRSNDSDSPSAESVTETFRRLLPAVTTLVAMHFQRTLIRRARERLVETGDVGGLADALEATESARLKITWT